MTLSKNEFDGPDLKTECHLRNIMVGCFRKMEIQIVGLVSFTQHVGQLQLHKNKWMLAVMKAMWNTELNCVESDLDLAT